MQSTHARHRIVAYAPAAPKEPGRLPQQSKFCEFARNGKICHVPNRAGLPIGNSDS